MAGVTNMYVSGSHGQVSELVRGWSYEICKFSGRFAIGHVIFLVSPAD